MGMTTSRQMLPMATTSALLLLLLVRSRRRRFPKERPQPQHARCRLVSGARSVPCMAQLPCVLRLGCPGPIQARSTRIESLHPSTSKLQVCTSASSKFRGLHCDASTAGIHCQPWPGKDTVVGCRAQPPALSLGTGFARLRGQPCNWINAGRLLQGNRICSLAVLVSLSFLLSPKTPCTAYAHTNMEWDGRGGRRPMGPPLAHDAQVIAPLATRKPELPCTIAVARAPSSARLRSPLPPSAFHRRDKGLIAAAVALYQDKRRTAPTRGPSCMQRT